MADRVVASTDTLNYFRHEVNGTAADVGDIADILSASSFIASSTDVAEAIVAINSELPEITADGFVFPVGTMVFEGSDFSYTDSGDAFETTLAFTDPTADRTVSLPNASGTVIISDSSTNIVTIPDDLIIKDGGTDIFIIKDAPIAVGSSLVVVGGNQKVVLEADDAIQIASSVTQTVEVSLSILEMS